MVTQAITLQLSDAQANLLHELFERLEEKNLLQKPELALAWKIQSMIEKQSMLAFDSDYKAVVEKERKQLRKNIE